MDTLLPRYPTAEVIEQMALAYSTDWSSASEDMREWWRMKSADVYQCLRQFYPEHFE